MDIHLIDISCFGFSFPKKDSWYMLLHKVSSDPMKDWKADIDFDKFQKNLSDNVESSYYRMVGITFEDLATDQQYYASFNNGIKKWTLEIPGSPNDAVLKEDKDAFFKSEEFKNTCKRADEILTNALKSFDNMLQPKIEKGEFLEVDETRLEAIRHMLSDLSFRRNLKLGKYEK